MNSSDIPGTSPALHQACQAIIDSNHHGDRRAAITRIDALLADVAQSPEAEHRLVKYLKRQREVWLGSLDPDDATRDDDSGDSLLVLKQRCRDAMNARQGSAALRYAWMFFQRCSPGTALFLDACGCLSEAAVMVGDVTLARHAAQLFVSGYDLLRRAIDHPETPVGHEHFEASRSSSFALAFVFFMLPIRAALHGMGEEAADCWIRVLEIAVSETPVEFRGARGTLYGQSVLALIKYYQARGDTASAARLQTRK